MPTCIHRSSVLPRRQHSIFTTVVALLWLILPGTSFASGSLDFNLSRFESGAGPSTINGVHHLLDGRGGFDQSNAIALAQQDEGLFAQRRLRCRFRVLAGGDGGAFLLLNTDEYGTRGPAPYLKNWVAPNLMKSFAVGIDVHNPPDDDPFSSWGNYEGKPQREVSLHWDGREIVKRLAPTEFRGQWTELDLNIQHVVGGAEITLLIAGESVYKSYFIAGMQPYEARLAIGAGTRRDANTEFDVKDITLTSQEPTQFRRLPRHIELFNHVRTHGPQHRLIKDVTLPPAEWAFGRVILTLEVHDAGPEWDKWDRNGSVYVHRPDGSRFDIAPFITSFRKPGRWQVDVTHFRPWLSGESKVEIAIISDANQQKGFMISASLDFYHGLPELEAFRIVPLWSGTARYTSAENHYRDFFTPREVRIDPASEAVRLLITTTGHAPVGEFTPAHRSLVFVPDLTNAPDVEQRFENLLWKDDVYLNPVRPQFGTWKYARAGWAPGDMVRPWWVDLTPYIVPGQVAQIRYLPQPYDFSDRPASRRPSPTAINQAALLVRSYLIFYRTPENLRPAPLLKVLDVLDGSNAKQAEVAAGDFLISYDGKRVETIEGLRALIHKTEAAGRPRVQLKVERAGEEKILLLSPGQMGVMLEEH